MLGFSSGKGKLFLSLVRIDISVSKDIYIL
jgi:hypothetical protein